MNDNELIKREYRIAMDEFERELKRIDGKYNTFAKIEVDSEKVYTIGDAFPKQYLRNIELEEIIIK